MKAETVSEKFAALVVVTLLILTAWGNAWVMLGVSAVGILISLVLYPASVSRRIIALIGAAFVIAMLLAMSLGRLG